MIYITKINLGVATKFNNLPTKCPLTFLVLLDWLQDINSQGQMECYYIFDFTSGKGCFFLLFWWTLEEEGEVRRRPDQGVVRSAQTQLLRSQRKSRVPASAVTMVTRPTSVLPTCLLPREAHHGNQTSGSGKLVLQVSTVRETGRTPPPSRGDSKMYSQRFGIVQREVKGPTTKVVIVVSTGCVRVSTAFCILAHSSLAEPNLASSWGSLKGNKCPIRRGWILKGKIISLPYAVPSNSHTPPPPSPPRVSYDI